jgi:hypothetical protein
MITYFLLLLFAAAVSFPLSAKAQPDLLGSLGPDLGRARPFFQYQVSPTSKETVEGQNRDFQATRHAVFLSAPLFQDRRNEWTFSGRFRLQDIRTDAILPDTREPFPDSLWDVRLGTGLRRKFENGWIAGGSLAVGSVSDKPFRSEAEATVEANLFARIPDGEKNAWLFFLNYSRYREFLNHLPLPGAAYWFEPSAGFRLLAGIPFSSLQWKPGGGLSVELLYFMIRTVRARVSYRFLPALGAYAEAEWRNEYAFRYDRRERDKRLAYYEKRVLAGLQWNFAEGLSLDLGGGYAFDRFYFEGERYRDRNENRLNLGNGFFGVLRLGASF